MPVIHRGAILKSTDEPGHGVGRGGRMAVKTALIIDDEPLAAQNLAAKVKNINNVFSVETISNPLEALPRLRRDPPGAQTGRSFPVPGIFPAGQSRFPQSLRFLLLQHHAGPGTAAGRLG